MQNKENSRPQVNTAGIVVELKVIQMFDTCTQNWSEK